MQLTCQHWDNNDQISFNKNGLIANNNIELSIGDCFWHWNKPPIVSNFCGYVNAPNVNHDKYPGFENVLVTKNNVILGYRKLKDFYEESTKLFCFWGNTVDESKIKMVDNNITSAFPQPAVVKSFWQKVVGKFKKIFGIK